jgi:hypothetical protein
MKPQISKPSIFLHEKPVPVVLQFLSERIELLPEIVDSSLITRGIFRIIWH